MKKIMMIYSDLLFKDDIRFIASTGRFINIAQIYQKAGYEVVIATYSSDNKFKEEFRDGMKIYYLDKPNMNKFEDFTKAGKYFCEELSKLEDLSKFSSIVYYGTSLKFSVPISKLVNKFNLSSVAIVNEWGNFKLKQTPSYLLQKAGIKYVSKKFNGVISISSFMNEYFSKHNLPSIIVPSVFDFDQLPKPVKRQNDKQIVISYAGTIANGKDSMSVVMEALSLLSEDQLSKIHFNLYGSTREQVEHALGDKHEVVLNKVDSNITFKGHYERENLQSELVKSDFTILIRPNLPYANAGFPTKFAESLSLGVPVIANATSDIASYLKTDINGLLVLDDSLTSVKQSLEKAVSFDEGQLRQLRSEAFLTGKQSFDYKLYSNNLLEFMKGLEK